MKPTLFISYSSRDSIFVKILLDRFQTSKAFNVWHDSYNLRSGDLLVRQIKHGIQNEAEIVLFYLSKSAIESEWVRKEFDWAVEKNRGSVFFVIDEEETREYLKKWRELPENKVIVINEEIFEEPLLELSNSMLSSFYKSLYPNVQVESVLEASYQKGISGIQFGRFTNEDDARLEGKIMNSKHIKLMMLNGSSFIQTFKACLQDFASKPGAKMDVLLVNEKNEFYNENAVLVSPIYHEDEDNKELVNRAISRLRAIFINNRAGLRVKKMNTQFRLPIIIFDDESAYLTINLPPSESIDGMTLELTAGTGEGGIRAASCLSACIRHFDSIFVQATEVAYR